VRAAQWLLPGGVFLAASVPSSDFLQTVKQQHRHLRLSLVSLAAQLAAGLLVLRLGGGIEAIAASTTLSLGFYALILILAATRYARSAQATP
jgi:O-antigen/teichoic acid export membrane protein